MTKLNKSIFNTEKSDYTTTPLFLGDPPGLFDTVNKRYPKIWDLYKRMKSLDWDENEFDFSSCNKDFKMCSKSVYDMMIKTLAWQWEADSVASRMIAPIVAPFVSSSELWAAWQRVSDNECLVEGTEVLTPNGWLDLKYVTPNTLVAQYDQLTSKISWVLPTHFIEKDYEGLVFEFKNHQGHYHQVVTPGHRMLKRKNSTGECFVELAEEIDFTKGSANDLISGISSGYISDNFSTLTALEAFLIAVQADGSISERYTGELIGTVPVWFGFSKERKITRLYNLCNAAGLEIIELTGDPKKGNREAQRRFKVNVPVQYAQFLKNFNWVNLQDKGRFWCEAFLEEIIQWDGHYTKNTGILHTTSRQAVEVTQAIASLCGMKTHLERYEDNRSDTFSDCWRLSWKRQDFVSGQGISKTSFNYSGKVRCITVPTGFFLMRFKDSVSVTGNCVHAATYSEIVRNSFDDPREVIDEVLSVKESFSRLSVISGLMKKVYDVSHRFAIGELSKDNPSVYEAIFMFTCALLCLERIQFMSSFAITFAIAETGLFLPIGKAVQKICQDEYEVHVELDKAILEHEMKTDRGQYAFGMCRNQIKSMIDEIVASEIAWTEYAFSEGRELAGLTKELLVEGVRWNAADVYRFFGFEVPYKCSARNPLGYMEDWVNISLTQTSPQEEKTGQYMLGAVVDTAGDKTYDIDF